MIVKIDGAAIRDPESFHDVLCAAFGFPDFYGRNFAALIDCLTYLDDPESGMSCATVKPGEVLTLLVENAKEFKAVCPDLYLDLFETVAFVNWRRIEVGERAVLALALYESGT